MPYKDPDKILAHNERLRIRRQTDINQWATRLVSNIPARARKLNIPFDLGVADLLLLVPKDHRCPVFGTKMTFGGPRSEDSMSLDRVDSSRGYMKNNCRVISLRANKLNSNATFDELQQLANYVGQHAPVPLHQWTSQIGL